MYIKYHESKILKTLKSKNSKKSDLMLKFLEYKI